MADLKSRVKSSRLPTSMEGSNFDYGFNTKTMQKLLTYWSTKYDWRKWEKELNKYPMFKTQIEGLDIHFVHIKPSKPAKETKALMLVHGWPSSFYDFYDMIPNLTTDPEISYEVIIPSLPGFAFSEASHRPGLDAIHAARILGKLMERLNHKHYLYHGEDWGSIIGKAFAVLYPDRLIGIHLSLPTAKFTIYSGLKILFGFITPGVVYDYPEHDLKRVHPVADKFYSLIREMGYFHMQATKPDTIGIALADSPAGLASYILDRWLYYTDPESYATKPDAGLTDKFTMDQLLTNVMIYWFSNSITSSMRFYKESGSYNFLFKLNFEKVVIREWMPVGIGIGPKEPLAMPHALLREVFYNVTVFNNYDKGGHFIAFEEPKMVADDIRNFDRLIKTKRLY